VILKPPLTKRQLSLTFRSRVPDNSWRAIPRDTLLRGSRRIPPRSLWFFFPLRPCRFGPLGFSTSFFLPRSPPFGGISHQRIWSIFSSPRLPFFCVLLSTCSTSVSPPYTDSTKSTVLLFPRRSNQMADTVGSPYGALSVLSTSKRINPSFSWPLLSLCRA